MSSLQQMLDGFNLRNLSAGETGFMPMSFDAMPGHLLATQDDVVIKRVVIRLSTPLTSGQLDVRLELPQLPAKTITPSDGTLIFWEIPVGNKTTIYNGDVIYPVKMRYTASSDMSSVGRVTGRVILDHELAEDWSDLVAVYRSNQLYKDQSGSFLVEKFNGYVAHCDCVLSALRFRQNSPGKVRGDLTVEVKVNDVTEKTVIISGSGDLLFSVDCSSDNINLSQGDEITVAYTTSKKFGPNGQLSWDMGVEVQY